MVYLYLMTDLDAMVRALGLRPHPEGGHYAETFRSAASTAIYYLLRRGERSAPHVVGSSDEVWHYYAGDPLELHLVGERHRVVVLGPEVTRGQRPQAVVERGVIQAARSLGEWTLCGCTVAPAFEFADFRLVPREELERRAPGLWDQLSVKTVSS
jgi:hypothetical protein